MDIITEVAEVADNALYISESKKKFIELLQKVGYKVRWGDKAKTANFKNRMEKHYVGNKGGSQWSELHLPVSIQEIIDMGIMEESTCSIYETAKTIEYMHLYGAAHVRGGDFCSLEYEEILRLLETHGFAVDKGKPYQ